MVSRCLAVLLVVAGLIAGAVAAPLASASPPSKGPCSSPTLSGPASALVGESYTITGCGFAPHTMISIEITEGGGCCRAQQIYTGDEGSFAYTASVWTPGTYRLRASVSLRRGWTVVAAWTFEAA